jgi:predicted DCC family thiol-disulfide oxidoreductase YuxK
MSALARAGQLVPRALRDAAYRFVAARRKRWFGGEEACKLPSEEDRAGLLP